MLIKKVRNKLLFLKKKKSDFRGEVRFFLIFCPVIKLYILTFLRKTIFIFLLNKNFFNMKNYLQLLRAIKERGVETSDRTGTGTLTLPGYHYTCPLYNQKGQSKICF